ncbi:hypothetical protein WR25_08087 [Diploscapter pachys]|uniref:Skp1-related protein n=1 Tax=Diploscapter pachys TaxID=2018661 RepID=A0A2A2L1R6_9BILA|nr:hypothetical protein WR25_08087 [Diploscapter pachys]
MIEMLGNDSNGLDAPIPMVNVDAVNLEKITRFLTRHENTELYKDPPPGPIAVPGTELSAIAAMTDDEIVGLLLATNYMGVSQFRDFICQHIANLIKGKTPEEVRARFNLENDFTPEEEKHIREVDVWAEKLPGE